MEERLAAALALFDDARYFEFHEVLEDLWREDRTAEREFYQGLLQAGVALHKLRLAQPASARKLFHKGRERLRRFGSRHRGVDLDRFLGDIGAWLDEGESRARRGLHPWPEGQAPRIVTTSV